MQAKKQLMPQLFFVLKTAFFMEAGGPAAFLLEFCFWLASNSSAELRLPAGGGVRRFARSMNREEEI